MNRTGPAPVLDAATLRDRLLATRALTLRLAEPLDAEDCQVQSMRDASPVKWHLAHTSWFFETFVLKPELRGYAPFDPAFEYLFNSYYNGIGELYPRAERGLMTRPGLEEVLAYRAHVDEALGRLLDAGTGEAVSALVELGLNHEQQHQELILTDIKHALSQNPRRPAYRQRPPDVPGTSPRLRWVGHPGGIIRIGHAGPTFAYDNEAPQHEVLVQPFELASRPVTNAEYQAFIDDDGYRRPELWLSDGWDWVQAGHVRAPLYRDPDSAACFTLAGEREMVPNEPLVHVSYYEADAYARWAGARLPREAEWEAFAAGRPVAGNFLDLDRLHPAPASDADLPAPQQLFGDVWEWTQSAYCAYPGFRPAAGTIGEYNGKFMCNQMVLRGGSCASPAGHLRASYRNFFPPAARWQFSGIRLAKDA